LSNPEFGWLLQMSSLNLYTPISRVYMVDGDHRTYIKVLVQAYECFPGRRDC